MGAQQRKFLFPGRALDLLFHCIAQVIEIAEWPLVPGTLRHPWGMFKNPANRRDKLVVRQRIEFFDGNQSWLMPAAVNSPAGWRALARRTAQKTRSGVAGLSSVTTPPLPNAAM